MNDYCLGKCKSIKVDTVRVYCKFTVSTARVIEYPQMEGTHKSNSWLMFGPSHVRKKKKKKVKYVQTDKVKSFCILSLTLIELQKILLCNKPWNTWILWSLYNIGRLIWNSQVHKQYLGQNVLLNSNIYGFKSL